MLSARQLFVLNWLNNNHQSRARWMRNGKGAYGDPETWDMFEISGRDGSIRVAVADWEAIREFKQITAADSGKMFAPNDAGLAALTTGKRPE